MIPWRCAVPFVQGVEADYGDTHERLVAAVLAAAADGQGMVRGIGRQAIASAAGITRDNAKWAVNELRHSGYMSVVGRDPNPEQRNNGIAIYRLHAPSEWPSGAAAECEA